jgi:DNA-directed RNA polymerase specialized sigma24 family protein
MADRPSPRQLKQMYRRLGSVPAVASELGIAFETARRWLLAAEVDLKPKGRPSRAASKLDDAALVARYESGESIASIGSAAGVSPTTVRNRLLRAGIQLRERPGWHYST